VLHAAFYQSHGHATKMDSRLNPYAISFGVLLISSLAFRQRRHLLMDENKFFNDFD